MDLKAQLPTGQAWTSSSRGQLLCHSRRLSQFVQAKPWSQLECPARRVSPTPLDAVWTVFRQQAPSLTLLPKDPSTQDKPPRCNRRGRSPKSQPGSSPKCRKLMKLVTSLLRHHVFSLPHCFKRRKHHTKTTCESVLFPAAAEWPKCRSRCAGTGGELE